MPAHPDWPDRDRFVLSAGHGSMLLYALLHLTGYPGMTMDELAQLPPARLQDGGPSRVRPCAGHRDDHGSAGPGPRQCRRHGAGRAPAQCAPRRRRRRPPHLCDRRRRLPDGGHQPGGDLARRAPQAQQADRAVRRQLHLHRRADLARRIRRPVQALRGLGLGGPGASTATIPRRSPPPSSAARALRQADADRLQDHHRLRRADQAGQGLHPRRAAGRRRNQGRAREAGLAACAPSRCRTTCWPPGARAGARGARSAQAWEQRAAKLDARQTAMLGDPIDAARRKALRGGDRRDQGRVRRRRRPKSPRALPRRRCWRSWCRRCPR